MGASTATTTTYAAYLLGDGGRPTLAGPTFSALADADEWCATHQTNRDETRDKWKVFALVPPSKPALPRPTRAFLLPVQGDPQEFWIPAGAANAAVVLNRAVDGNCTSHGVWREWSGRRGVFTLLTDHASAGLTSRMPINSVMGYHIGRQVRGPIIVVRLQCNHAGEDEDDADPDSHYLSIPADIQPSEWKTLLAEE